MRFLPACIARVFLGRATDIGSRSQEMIQIKKWRPRGWLSIFLSRISVPFQSFSTFLNTRWKVKMLPNFIICLENNGYQGLKNDKSSFRVDNTLILWSDAN